jgi:hypothetical protein
MTRRAQADRLGTTPAHLDRPGRRRVSRSFQLLAVSIGAAAGLLFVLAGVALAYWATTDSSNPAQAVAATLAAPTAGKAKGTATPSSVAIKWTAPTGYTPTGYTVLRCTGSSCTNFTAITDGTCSGTISGTSCTDTDTGLAAGTTYSYQVEGDLDNWVSAPSSSFTAATSAPSSLAFTDQPRSGQSIQATGTGSFPVEVAIEDANGNTASNDNTDTVTLAIASGANPGSGTLSCTGGLTATVSSGVASFVGCAITMAGSGYELTASSTSLTVPANANSFTITAGTFAQYGVVTAATATAGTAVTGVTLTAEDSDGNTVTSYSGSPSITWTGPADSPNGTKPTLPVKMVSFSSGVSTTALSVTFTDAGSQTLTATDGSSRTGSATTTVSAAPPASLVLANCVVAGTAQACNPPYDLGSSGTMVADVQALDPYGNAPVITSEITMSVTSSNPTVFTITSGATLTIDGTATPPNQSTTTFTVQDSPASSTITIHVTSGQSIPDLTFTAKSQAPA